MEDNTQNPQSVPQNNASQFEGVSNPPNGGRVTDVSTPESNDSTISTASGPNTPPQSQSQPQTAQPVQAQQSQTQNPQPQGQTQQQPNLAVPPKQTEQANQAAQAPMTPAQTAQVQRASVWNKVAQTLAGGPRYKYDVDSYGNMTRQEVPVSNAHLALAIALEAIGGGITGMANGQGPNGRARAAAAGYQQGQQQVKEQDQQAKQQATEDYARRAQVTETNMRMYMMARQIGKMDQESNQAYIGQFKDLADNLQKNYPGFVEGPISYKDFAKYNVTQDNAIPYQEVPRLDADGKQLIVNGVPQYDINYMIVKPGLKASNLLNTDDVKKMQDMGLLPKDKNADEMILKTPMQLMQALNLKSKIAQWGLGQTTYSHFYDGVDKYRNGSVSSDNVPTITPTVENKQVDQTADQVAQKYPNVPPALIKAIINQESGGNPNVSNSVGHTGGGSGGGAMGVMQITPAIAQQYGVTDPHNVQQNIEAGTHYLSDILKNPKVNGNLPLAMAAYIGGLSAVGDDGKLNLNGKSPENQKAVNDYVKGVSERLGLGLKQTAQNAKKSDPNAQPGTVGGQLNPDTRLDLNQWNEKYPRTVADNEQFMSILAHTEDNYGQALRELGTKDAQAAGNMMAFLGGPDAITAHDSAVAIRKEQVQKEIAAQESEKENLIKVNQKNAANQANADRMTAVVKGPDGFKFDPSIQNMSPEDAAKALEDKGVTVPENFEDLYSIAKYDNSPNDYTPKVWRTGDPNVMSKAQAISYIRKFLNPDYKEGDYKAVETARAQLGNENSPVGKMLSAAGTALYHMQTLRDAMKANGNGQIRLLNQLAMDFGVQVGDTPAATYAAIIPKLSDEVSKAAMAGGTPYQGQIEEGRESLAKGFSQPQVNSVLNAYTKLIHGRMVNQEAITRKTAKEHMPVPDNVTELFRAQGLATPWEEDMSKPVSSQEDAPPVPGAVAGRDAQGNIVAWKLPNGQVQYVNQANQPAGTRANNFVLSQRSTNPQQPIGPQ